MPGLRRRRRSSRSTPTDCSQGAAERRRRSSRGGLRRTSCAAGCRQRADLGEAAVGRRSRRGPSACCSSAAWSSGSGSRCGRGRRGASPSALAEADPLAEVRARRSRAPSAARVDGRVRRRRLRLWSELEACARRLLHDVDVLARAYGWTETEVLALGAAPGAYLELVGGARERLPRDASPRGPSARSAVARPLPGDLRAAASHSGAARTRAGDRLGAAGGARGGGSTPADPTQADAARERGRASGATADTFSGDGGRSFAGSRVAGCDAGCSHARKGRAAVRATDE